MRTLIAGSLLFPALLCAATASAQTAEEKKQSQDTIWTMEQSIYAGRAKADMSNYQNNTAENYLSWPPQVAKPMGNSKLKNTTTNVAVGSGKEKLDMEFMDFTQQDNTAIIYYQTHRTMLMDGTPVDQRFQVTHTWIKVGGKWQVLGGMARPATSPPAQ
jgi:hypothetical protein